MTAQELLQEAANKLKLASDTPRLDSEILLAQVMDFNRAQLLVNTNQLLTSKQAEQFEHLISERIQGVPIAYLLGHKEFWSLSFEVTSATLIPRPETELVVELALQKFAKEKIIRVADLGTGCGAIALALAAERPDWQIVATDISRAAIEVASRNTTKFALKNVTFALGNWVDSLGDQIFDLIVSNPPYIPEGDSHLTQGDLRFEPINALISGSDGLRDLNQIIIQAKKNLAPQGWLILEHGYDQSKKLQKILEENDYTSISDYKDLAGLDRVITGRH